MLAESERFHPMEEPRTAADFVPHMIDVALVTRTDHAGELRVNRVRVRPVRADRTELRGYAGRRLCGPLQRGL